MADVIEVSVQGAQKYFLAERQRFTLFDLPAAPLWLELQLSTSRSACCICRDEALHGTAIVV